MAALIVAVFVASLLGSVHCAGMCGPFAALAVGPIDAAQTARGGRRLTVLSARGGCVADATLRSHALLQLAYHGARLATYLFFGAAAGALGAALNFGGAALGLQRVAMVVAGGWMVVLGLVAGLRYAGIRLPDTAAPALLRRGLALGHAAAAALRPLPRAGAVGLLTSLLPCGWLYAFVITAAGTGSSFWGMVVMAAFWAGTVPVLAAIGVGTHSFGAFMGRRFPLVVPLILIGLGIYTVAGRAVIHPLPASASQTQLTPDHPDVGSSAADAADRVRALDSARSPCCQSQGRQE